MEAEQLSEALRTEAGLFMWCRRGLVFTCFVAILCMQIVGLYQMGIVRHLPEPPFPKMNADRVDAAGEAYSRMFLPMPDAFLGIFGFAITVALVVLGPPDRVERYAWVPLLMGLKVGFDAIQGGGFPGNNGACTVHFASGAWWPRWPASWPCRLRCRRPTRPCVTSGP